MTRRPQPFTQGDVTRALKGAVKAGLSVQSYTIDTDGNIVVITGKPSKRPEIEDATALV
jgi:hypothetical protein